MEVKNKYKVPAKQWRRWSKEARTLFNTHFYTLTHNQRLFLHPKQEPVPREFWKTTAWNSAWMAADAVNA